MKGRNPKIIVVGGTYIDMSIKCSQIPVVGQYVIGSTLSYSISGPGPVQSVQAALCGCEVSLISKIGSGSFAKMILEGLAEYNINTDYVQCVKAKNTGVHVTMINSEGENAGCLYSGANSALVPMDITTADEAIAEADVCLIHGELPQETIVEAIRCAKLHGTKTILDPARPLEQKEDGCGELPAEYFAVDVIIPNLSEAADITDQTSVGLRNGKLIGSDLIARGVKHAVITMGKRGCLVVNRNGADNIPAFEVELVNQSGRGDAFNGALAAYYAIKDDIHGAVKFASAAGALTCTKFGLLEALPTKADIIQVLQEHDTDH
ncbi:MAG: ribokinase [Sedimentisphaerales bacterium]|nr:ribokinase [Sedimentisphaerales bacterium]